MGGMGGIMGMMPGMGKMKDQMAAAGLDDKMFGRQLAIISSMTKAERGNPDISEAPPQEAHRRRFRHRRGRNQQAAQDAPQMADMMKAMGGKGKGGGMMRGMMGGLANKMGLGGMMPGGTGGMMGGGMPDLSKMDPQAARSLAEAGGGSRPRRRHEGPARRPARLAAVCLGCPAA